MTSVRRVIGAALAAAFLLCVSAWAADRASVPEKYTWNQQDLYPNKDAWQADRDAVAKRIPEIAAFKGHLGDSAQSAPQGPADLGRHRQGALPASTSTPP